MQNRDSTMSDRMERAQEKTAEKAEQATDKVAEAAGKVSKSLSDAAGKVDQPRVSEALRSTAQAAGNAEAQLRVKGARGLMLGAVQWAKAHPESYLLLAVGVGLILGAAMRRNGEHHEIAEGAVVVMEVKEIR
jgi:hypothetical protein